MAANLGSLAATITANTKPFQKGMKTAGGDMNKMQQGANKFSMKGMLGKLALAAGAAVAFGMALSKVKGQLTELDNLGKTASKLGIGVQELERLRYAASLAGVEADGFDKSLEKMQRGLSEAAHGTGTAKLALEDLGLSAAKLAQQSPDQQMMILADAIKKIENPAEKARVAYQIFGREGVNMLNMLGQGSAAIEEQGKKFDKLNGVMSEGDIKGVEAANDAMTDLGVAIKGAWRSFTIAIAPALKLLAKFITFIVQAIKFLSKFTGLGLLLKGLRALGGKSQEKAVGQQKKITPLLENQLEKEKAITAEKEKQAADIKRQGDAITKEFMTPQEKFQERVSDLNRLVEAGAISWQTYNRALGGAVKDMKEANKQTDKLAKRKAIGIVTRGSTAGFSAVQAARRESEHQRRLAQQQIDEQIETNRILASIETKTKPTTVAAVRI